MKRNNMNNKAMQNQTTCNQTQKLPAEQALWQELPVSKQSTIFGGTANQTTTSFELSMPVDTVEKPSGGSFVNIPVKIGHSN